jgi:ceramide glucosyltransferase
MGSLRESLTEWMLYGPAIASLALYFCAMLLVALYVAYFHRRSRYEAWQRREIPGHNESLPLVSILKPLCGQDCRLEQNLASFARIDYPSLEIICRAEDPFDTALIIARRVAARYPHVRFRIFSGSGADPSQQAAINPKVGQLLQMSDVAIGQLLLLSDSNVSVGPMDLRALVASMSHPSIGLVYQPFVGVGEATVGAAVENLRNTEFPGMLCIGARLFAGQPVVTAKGILVRRSALDSIGGFSSLVEYHNDDHLLALSVKRKGWKLKLAAVPAKEVQCHRTLRETLTRHARHAAGRWRCCPIACGLEVLFSPVLLSAPLFYLGASGGKAFLAIAGIKYLIELLVGRMLRGVWLAPRFWMAMPLKDLLLPFMLVKGLFINRVCWRGAIYRMGRSSRLFPIRPFAANGELQPTPMVGVQRRLKARG